MKTTKSIALEKKTDGRLLSFITKYAVAGEALPTQENMGTMLRIKVGAIAKSLTRLQRSGSITRDGKKGKYVYTVTSVNRTTAVPSRAPVNKNLPQPIEIKQPSMPVLAWNAKADATMRKIDNRKAAKYAV